MIRTLFNNIKVKKLKMIKVFLITLVANVLSHLICKLLDKF